MYDSLDIISTVVVGAVEDHLSRSFHLGVGV
jgi:hypothetical protein